MLKLLLDEHISPDVAAGLHARLKSLIVHALSEWENGKFLGQSDDLILEKAVAQRLTLVTYDCRTIPLLLKIWAESGRHHGGVIFIDTKTIPPSDIGGLIRALEKLFRATSKWRWTDQVIFLRK